MKIKHGLYCALLGLSVMMIWGCTGYVAKADFKRHQDKIANEQVNQNIRIDNNERGMRNNEGQVRGLASIVADNHKDVKNLEKAVFPPK